MPSQKTRSKEDTWTTDELSRALNKTGERRHHRDKDDDRKREKINGEDKHRRKKDEDNDDDRRRRHKDDDRRSSKNQDEGRESAVRLTEEERERQRQERREKREGKDSTDKRGKGEITFRGKGDDKQISLADVHEDSDRERRHRSDRDRRHRDDDRERRHRDDKDDRRKHRDPEQDEEDERERRREERRKAKEAKEGDDRPRRHDEKRDKRKDEDRDRRKDRDERSDRHRDKEERSDKHRKDKGRETEEERAERKEREREERRREREKEKEIEREERKREKEKEKKHKSSRHEEEKQEVKKEEEDENGDYEDDFEDYDDDFEDEEDDEEAEPTIKGSIHKDKRSGTQLDYSDSEVNDVLRALDAENERLLTGSKSPQASKNHSSFNNHQDSEDDDDDNYTYKRQAQERPRTAINFVSAKQRAVSRKTASKTMQRGNDLLKMLELDFASFDILDMPPVNEYDLYIRAFGSSDSRQAYVQTNDDNIDRELQTEEVDVRQKWTQHPPEDYTGCGRGDGEKDMDEEEESYQKQNKEQDMGRLNKFLEKAGQVIAILLEEGKEEESKDKGRSQSHIAISDGYTELDLLPVLHGRYVSHSHFSPVQPNLLLTVYSPAPEISSDNPVSKRGIICVWNTNEPNYPQKILACSSQPLCCCFSPVKPSLVFAGMVDGSIAMWDLREASTLHRPTMVNQEEYSLRYPTYDTAGVLNDENHHSPVSCITPIYSYIDSSKSENQQTQASEDTSSGMSFQLVSTEESAVLHFWVVAELSSADISGSQNDYGLAPGGGVKLLKSSSLILENPSRLLTGLRALDMKLLPSDPNQFYVSTDSGMVIHGLRFGKRAFPRTHSPVIDAIVDVVSIDFSPFEQPCFLAGCTDGTFSLYHTKSENPLISWPTVTKGNAVQCVRWSRSRPCVFYVLDVTSTLYIFDLLEGDTNPKQIENIAKEKVISFTLTNDHKANGLGTPGKEPQILFSLENGRTEIHTVSKSLAQPEQLETDYLLSYLQRF